jgi:hypothetical protein
MGFVGKATTFALVCLPALALSQVHSPRPGGDGVRLPQHVEQQLWPTRELTPVEAELKQHVTTIGDSLRRLDASVALLERQRRSQASDAVIRSTTRTLAADCARAGRTAVPVDSFANTLRTDNARWGEPALRNYRDAITHLRRAMQGCSDAAAALATAREAVSPDRVTTIAEQATEAVRGYQTAEQGLLRTLRMDIYPDRKASR